MTAVPQQRVVFGDSFTPRATRGASRHRRGWSGPVRLHESLHAWHPVEGGRAKAVPLRRQYDWHRVSPHPPERCMPSRRPRGLGRHQASPEPRDHEPARRRAVHEQRPEVPPGGEPWASIDAQRPALRRPHLRPPEPPDSKGGQPDRPGRADARAQPVDRCARQRLRVRLGPRRCRRSNVRRQPARRVSRGRECDAAACPSGQQEREQSTRPHDPDQRERNPAGDDDRRLEPTEPMPFHTQVSRCGVRRPRRWSRRPTEARGNGAHMRSVCELGRRRCHAAAARESRRHAVDRVYALGSVMEIWELRVNVSHRWGSTVSDKGPDRWRPSRTAR